VEQWRPYAEGLKASLVSEGVLCDAGLTTDAARLLRIPGTKNHKYTPPRLVKLLESGRLFNFEKSFAFLTTIKVGNVQKATTEADVVDPGFGNAKPCASLAALAPSNALQAGIEPAGPQLVDPKPIFEQCGFLKEAKNTGGKNYDQPQWNLSVLCTVFMEGGNALAHEISKGHKGYQHADTQALYDRKLVDRAVRGVGYPSCRAIASAGCKSCATCAHFSKGKSPVHLTGAVTATVSSNATAVTGVPASQVLYLPGNEQECREFLNQAVAADGRTFTLGDRSGPLIILRKPEEDTLPSATKWEGDLPAATLAKTADIMMRAERLQWMQRAGGKSGTRMVRTSPPRAFINDYLDQMRGQYAAPPLRGIVRVPRIDDRGTIHSAPGYDPKTGLFHDKVPSFHVPLAPDLDSARRAAQELLVPFSKYQFEDVKVGRALLLAAIFSILERPFISAAPMFVIRSSMPGTGKGLIVNTLVRLAFDTKPVIVTWGGSTEEFEKRLAALLLQAPAALSIDNANGMQIKGDLLESIITEGSADIRPLGRSETVRVRNRSCLMLTGNNPVITGDMARRALSISILPRSSDPERDRYAFNPVTVVGESRAVLLEAAFTVMAAFRLAGMPQHGLPAAGSFDEWSRKVRDLVYWITDYDVADAFRQNKAEDPRRQGDAALLAALHQRFGSQPFRAAEVLAVHKRVVDFRRSMNSSATCTASEQAVHEALENVLGARDLTPKVVGYWARRMRGARTGGYILEIQQNTTTHANDITVRRI
jgi:hypothetical protein